MKKYTVISLLGILTFSFLVFSVPAGIAAPVETGTSADTLLVGTSSFGYDLDPANAWDSGSFDIIYQVVEGFLPMILEINT
jgi:ABC-type oligopeptide transport system substrate-binding subunit